MSRAAPQKGLMPSILDRLIDADSEGTNWKHGYDLQQIVDTVRRDLEDLLNSHPPYYDIPAEWSETSRSLLTFGLPDFNSIQTTDREELARLIEHVVERFEPRLRNVRARVVGGADAKDRTVRFHIEAQINADPAPEVAFETILELSTGHTTIQSSETPA